MLFLSSITPIGILMFYAPFLGVRLSGNGYWLALNAAAAAGILIIFFFLTAAKKCGGNPFVFLRDNVGRTASAIFFICFVLFYTALCALFIKIFTYTVKTYMIKTVPVCVLYAVLAAAAAYFSSAGMRNSARLSVAAGSIGAAVIVLILSITTGKGDLRNLAPAFEIKSGGGFGAFLLLGALSFIPCSYIMLINNSMKVKKRLWLSVLCAFVVCRILILACSASISVLGIKTAAEMPDAILTALKSFSFEREVFFGKTDVTFIFFYTFFMLCALSALFAPAAGIFCTVFQKAYTLYVCAALFVIVFALSFVPAAALTVCVFLFGAASAVVFPLIIIFSGRKKLEENI